MNFISINVMVMDKKLFFGPNHKEEKFTIIKPHWNLANIIVAAGVFKSTKQARKNGFNKPISKGFDILTVGKNKKQIFILNL